MNRNLFFSLVLGGIAFSSLVKKEFPTSTPEEASGEVHIRSVAAEETIKPSPDSPQKMAEAFDALMKSESGPKLSFEDAKNYVALFPVSQLPYREEIVLRHLIQKRIEKEDAYYANPGLSEQTVNPALLSRMREALVINEKMTTDARYENLKNIWEETLTSDKKHQDFVYTLKKKIEAWTDSRNNLSAKKGIIGQDPADKPTMAGYLQFTNDIIEKMKQKSEDQNVTVGQVQASTILHLANYTNEFLTLHLDPEITRLSKLLDEIEKRRTYDIKEMEKSVEGPTNRWEASFQGKKWSVLTPAEFDQVVDEWVALSWTHAQQAFNDYTTWSPSLVASRK